MSFVVTWDAEIAAEIDTAISSLPSRQANRIADSIERLHGVLRTNALDVGESREAGLVRVFAEPPVTVHYRISNRLQLVRVFSVKISRP